MPNDIPAPFAIGPARYEMTARGLTEQEYIGASRKLLNLVRSQLKPRLSRSIIYLIGMLAVGMLVGYAAAEFHFSARLVTAYGNPPQTTLFHGWGLMAIAGVIFLAGIATQVFAISFWQKKLYRRSVATSRTFSLPQTLTFADNGVSAACETGLSALPWSRVTHRFNHAGLQFLVFDSALIFWLQQEELDASPGLAQLLNEKIAVPLQ